MQKPADPIRLSSVSVSRGLVGCFPPLFHQGRSCLPYLPLLRGHAGTHLEEKIASGSNFCPSEVWNDFSGTTTVQAAKQIHSLCLDTII
jgi:hypothetical protein